MKKWIANLRKRYRNIPFEKRNKVFAIFSVIFNFILAFGKLVLAWFFGVFFFVAAVINIFTALSKMLCYRGMKDGNSSNFKKYNTFISIFEFLAGVQYTIYMVALFVGHRSTFNYDQILGIAIALVSFIEVGVAIYGLIKVSQKGYYYRDIKLINFGSALTALVLTEIALTSSSSETDMSQLNGIFGIVIGGVICLLGIIIYFMAELSIADRLKNDYLLEENKKAIMTNDISIALSSSFWYGGYSYMGKVKDNFIEGSIVKEKSSISTLQIWLKIVLLIFSEILILIYFGGAVVNFCKSRTIISKLDQEMKKLGYSKTFTE